MKRLYQKVRGVKSFTWFLLILGAGIIFFFFLSVGYYPIALIGGDIVSAREFFMHYESAVVYSTNLVSTYGQSSSVAAPPVETLELQASVLEQLIEDVFIEQELLREMGKDEMNRLVEAKVGKYDSDARLRRAAPALFGVGFDVLRQRLLMPRARREILTGRLFLKGEDFNAWLSRQKRERRVLIFSGALDWRDGGVKTKGNKGER
jgi:hypothetical protein